MDTEVLDDSDTVSVDDEIDPRDLDIGFHEDITAGPDKAAPQTTPSIVPRDPQGDDPTKYFNQDTNFFSQPGILTGVYFYGMNVRVKENYKEGETGLIWSSLFKLNHR